MIRERGGEFAELSVERCCRASAVPRSLVYRALRRDSGGELLEAVLCKLERFPCYGLRRRWALASRRPGRSCDAMGWQGSDAFGAGPAVRARLCRPTPTSCRLWL